MKNWFLIPVLLVVVLLSCRDSNSGHDKELRAALNSFKVDSGMEVKLVASEPLIQAPVSMTFDEKGRIWAVEMIGFMPDTLGTDEYKNPNGKIVILEDKNHDGVMDTRKVFMDSLILPRSIAFYKEGILLAEPPNLWYIKIKDDKPVEKYLVDSLYAVGGTVEHQPNGLLRGMDNWFYNAKSDARYRFKDGRWIKEKTHFRGQWGISQDDYGRLFYNNNSVNLLGDYFLPGLGAWNANQRQVSGFNENIIHDNRTYPIHPTPGVNRGYMQGVLDDSLRLLSFTAACGPVINRSHFLGEEYLNNAFVAEPAGNLIKRDILSDSGFAVMGKQAYQGREFLASNDERFRPVNLSIGPDGALYIVDMYRGILQDAAFITAYLKNHIAELDLQHPLNKGRIYKVTPKGAKSVVPVLAGKTPEELTDLLNSPEPWVRETAQRLIIDRNLNVQDALRNKIKGSSFSELGKIHSFWTLEGLGVISNDDVIGFLNSGNTHFQQQALAELVSDMDASSVEFWAHEMDSLLSKPDQQMLPYLAFFWSKVNLINKKLGEDQLKTLALENYDNKFITDAVISGLAGEEQTFMKAVIKSRPDTGATLYKGLAKAIAVSKINAMEAKEGIKPEFFAGKRLFSTYCQSCHGESGEGIPSLGPPLMGSQWVMGDKATLVGIVLHGLTGPIKVGDKVYRQPEIGGEMPGFVSNPDLNNSSIAALLSFIRNAWGNKAEVIDPKEMSGLRLKSAGRTQPYTMAELK